MAINQTAAIALALALGAGLAHAEAVSGQGTWETTLLARDLDGDGVTDAFYDTVLDITWLRAGSTTTNTWEEAKAWAEATRYGLSGWRLPTLVDTGVGGDRCFAVGLDCGYNPPLATSEMANLFYEALGNKAAFEPGTGTPQVGGLTNTGDFLGLQAYAHWLGLDYAPVPGAAWQFNTYDGGQFAFTKDTKLYALAVRTGDAALDVPEPATAGLVLTSLVALMAARRKRIKAGCPTAAEVSSVARP